MSKKDLILNRMTEEDCENGTPEGDQETLGALESEIVDGSGLEAAAEPSHNTQQVRTHFQGYFDQLSTIDPLPPRFFVNHLKHKEALQSQALTFVTPNVKTGKGSNEEERKGNTTPTESNELVPYAHSQSLSDAKKDGSSGDSVGTQSISSTNSELDDEQTKQAIKHAKDLLSGDWDSSKIIYDTNVSDGWVKRTKKRSLDKLVEDDGFLPVIPIQERYQIVSGSKPKINECKLVVYADPTRGKKAFKKQKLLPKEEEEVILEVCDVKTNLEIYKFRRQECQHLDSKGMRLIGPYRRRLRFSLIPTIHSSCGQGHLDSEGMRLIGPNRRRLRFSLSPTINSSYAQEPDYKFVRYNDHVFGYRENRSTFGSDEGWMREKDRGPAFDAEFKRISKYRNQLLLGNSSPRPILKNNTSRSTRPLAEIVREFERIKQEINLRNQIAPHEPELRSILKNTTTEPGDIEPGNTLNVTFATRVVESTFDRYNPKTVRDTRLYRTEKWNTWQKRENRSWHMKVVVAHNAALKGRGLLLQRHFALYHHLENFITLQQVHAISATIQALDHRYNHCDWQESSEEITLRVADAVDNSEGTFDAVIDDDSEENSDTEVVVDDSEGTFDAVIGDDSEENSDTEVVVDDSEEGTDEETVPSVIEISAANEKQPRRRQLKLPVRAKRATKKTSKDTDTYTPRPRSCKEGKNYREKEGGKSKPDDKKQRSNDSREMKRPAVSNKTCKKAMLRRKIIVDSYLDTANYNLRSGRGKKVNDKAKPDLQKQRSTKNLQPVNKPTSKSSNSKKQRTKAVAIVTTKPITRSIKKSITNTDKKKGNNDRKLTKTEKALIESTTEVQKNCGELELAKSPVSGNYLFYPPKVCKPDLYTYIRLVGKSPKKPERKLKSSDASKFYCFICGKEFNFSSGCSNQIIRHNNSDDHKKKRQEKEKG